MNAGQSADADRRGVSPVIGVILMVAVAVVLGSIVAVYAFDLTDLTGEPAPTVTFSEQYEEGEGVTITVENSDGVDGERLAIDGVDPDGAVSYGSWPTSGPVEAGDIVTFPAADGNEEFRVVWTPEGEDRSFVLTEFVLSGGERVFRVEDGAVAFEAESFDVVQQPRTVGGEAHTWEEGTDSSRQSGASSGTYLVAEPTAGNDNGYLDPNGPRLDYLVDFESAGTYYIWVRMQGPNGDDDSVHAGLEGTLASDRGLGMTVGGSGWKWTSEAGGQRVKVDVGSPGVHTVSVWMREDGTPFDKVIVTDDASYAPSGKDADGT
ncbi:type IV pilin [Salinirubellus salinus]